MRGRAPLRALALALAVSAALVACRRGPSSDEPPLEYKEFVTGAPAAPGESLPLVVGIHGLGDAPELFLRTFALEMRARVRIVAPRAPTPEGQGFSWFALPETSLSGASFAGGVSRAGDRVAALIEKLEHDLKPPGRAIVFGYSQGGILAYYVAAKHPDLVTAELPISGLLPQPLAPDGVPAPTFAYHGTRDERVPVEGARATIAAFKAAGGSAELREYPHLGHAVSMALIRDVQAKIVELLPSGVR